MRLILQLFVICVIATSAGLGLTALAVRHPPAIDVIEDGPWAATASEGASEVDAYALAALAYRGEVPLPIADGLSFRARKDQDGHALSGSCSYIISGVVPNVRAWSLAAFDSKGRPFPNPAQRFGYSSADVVRDAEGAVQIALSASAHSGDWIPVVPDTDVVLILRLYDTTAAAISSGRSAPELPTIKKIGCSE